MSRIPPEIVDQIMSTARIEEVVGEFVVLKKSGSNFKGLSPFNNEKTPSFVVSPARGIFKDFSSGRGGNSVTFLMELEQLSFPEALRWLARKYNIEIPEARPQTPEEIEQGNMREAVYLISEVAAKWYVDQMNSTEEGRAVGLGYFTERGFTAETVSKFGLGYSPKQMDAFAKWALEKGYSEKALLESGISMKNERGWYDRFRGRVMFPIYSISGRVLGFGGRILDSQAKAAKYLNSPENPIYHKSKVLYGLYQAKQEIVKRDEALLVEGYTDVLSFHQKGVVNVVASSGTALTEEQIAMLKRYTPNITLLYDGDAAGIRASFRGLDMMLEQGVNVRVVPFPEGDDPDSFAQRHSVEELEAYLTANRTDFISFKAGVLLKEAGSDPLKRADMIKTVVQSIAKVPNPIGQEVFIKEASKILEIEERTLFGELSKLLGERQRQADKKQQQQPTMKVVPDVQKVARPLGFDQESKIMEIIIAHGHMDMGGEDFDEEEGEARLVIDFVVDALLEESYTFETPLFQRLYESMLERMEQGFLPDETWWVRRHDPDEVSFVTETLTEKYQLANWESKEIYLPSKKSTIVPLVMESLERLRFIIVERKLKELLVQIQQAEDEHVVNNLMNTYYKWTQLRSKINDKLNRVV